MLRKPGFVLTAEQKDAIRTTFEHKVSVITGPPGVGKTAVIALINAIAAMLWSEIEHPAWVMALAGRAASNAREAGTCWHGHGCIPLHATTIHRAIGLRGEGDDGPEAFEGGSKITCGVLILEEISMDNSPLLDAILRRANFTHLVLVGDPDQLPPIGQGKPFRDILTSNTIPVTRLNKNWRTDCQGIRALCQGMLAGDPEMMAYALDDYEQAGGVHFVVCERRDRAAEAAKIYAKLTRKRGVDLDDIAILGPHNQGDEAGIRIAMSKPGRLSSFPPIGSSKVTYCLSRKTITKRRQQIRKKSRPFTTANGVALKPLDPITSTLNFREIPRV
jgi:exodeoxyribonuclease V alpha subunit